MSFHFSKEQPTASLQTDIQSLDKFSNEQFREATNLGITFAVSIESSNLQTAVREYGERYNLNTSALKNIFKSFLIVINAAVKKNLTPLQVKEDFSNLGLSSEKADYISHQWKENLGALSRSALSQTLMVNQLVDMEWKFGVTASSSDLNKVGNTFLQLKLVINKGNKVENLYMELTLPQFYSFLHEMEKAKSSLEYFN